MSEVIRYYEADILNARSTVPVQPVDSDDVLTHWDLLHPPVLRVVTGPLHQVLLVLAEHLQPIDAVLLRSDSKGRWPLRPVQVQLDWALLVPGSPEDGRLHAVGQGCADACHEVVFVVVPDLYLGQF